MPYEFQPESIRKPFILTVDATLVTSDGVGVSGALVPEDSAIAVTISADLDLVVDAMRTGENRTLPSGAVIEGADLRYITTIANKAGSSGNFALMHDAVTMTSTFGLHPFPYGVTLHPELDEQSSPCPSCDDITMLCTAIGRLNTEFEAIRDSFSAMYTQVNGRVDTLLASAASAGTSISGSFGGSGMSRGEDATFDVSFIAGDSTNMGNLVLVPRVRQILTFSHPNEKDSYIPQGEYYMLLQAIERVAQIRRDWATVESGLTPAQKTDLDRLWVSNGIILPTGGEVLSTIGRPHIGLAIDKSGRYDKKYVVPTSKLLSWEFAAALEALQHRRALFISLFPTIADVPTIEYNGIPEPQGGVAHADARRYTLSREVSLDLYFTHKLTGNITYHGSFATVANIVFIPAVKLEGSP